VQFKYRIPSMATKQVQEAQNPLILRCNRLIEAFAKSDDERDFYLDRSEGFIIYIDLDKPDEELIAVELEIEKHTDRYCMIPKLTFYETKKIMEGFVNEKVYDIDTKEKLLDIIQSKEARENFLDFLYDHHSEFEKWQTYYQERSRIRIIEWLRNNNFYFVFEEDLELPSLLIEKLKKELFQSKASKEVLAARKILSTKAKTYYSNEALNPRPKRGRPPKQTIKTEIEPQITTDIYIAVPQVLRTFLFTPDPNSTISTFSSHFGNENETFNRRIENGLLDSNSTTDGLNQKLAALRSLSNKWTESENAKSKNNNPSSSGIKTEKLFEEFNDDDDEEDDIEDEDLDFAPSSKAKGKKINNIKKAPVTKSKNSLPSKATNAQKKSPPSRVAASRSSNTSSQGKPVTKPSKQVISSKPISKAPAKAKLKPSKKPEVKAKPIAKKASSTSTKKPLRSIMKLKRKSK
jgi:hypothetical protein